MPESIIGEKPTGGLFTTCRLSFVTGDGTKPVEELLSTCIAGSFELSEVIMGDACAGV